jgi:hypothetical protein
MVNYLYDPAKIEDWPRTMPEGQAVRQRCAEVSRGWG